VHRVAGPGPIGTQGPPPAPASVLLAMPGGAIVGAHRLTYVLDSTGPGWTKNYAMPDCRLAFSFVLLAVAVADPGSTLPNGHAWGCLPGNISASKPFCDASRPIAERVANLVSLLTLDEKIGFLSADNHTHVDACNMMSSGCIRLGVPPYMHLVETNTAVASTCLGPNKCSTNYPGPPGLGASFNRSLWRAKGHAMGEEMRAFNNLRWYRATGDAPHSLIGLNGYGPNLNIARDPRYGRISEVPGEDPFLTGTCRCRNSSCVPPAAPAISLPPCSACILILLRISGWFFCIDAVEMVRGGQGNDAYESGKSQFLKMTLGLKHYALYTVETPRASFIPLSGLLIDSKCST
jgi:hypothetical protein